VRALVKTELPVQRTESVTRRCSAQLQIGSGVMPVLARQLNGILEDEEEEEGGLAESAGPGDQWRVRSLLSDSAM
jgi:hypothetical protein